MGGEKEIQIGEEEWGEQGKAFVLKVFGGKRRKGKKKTEDS